MRRRAPRGTCSRRRRAVRFTPLSRASAALPAGVGLSQSGSSAGSSRTGTSGPRSTRWHQAHVRVARHAHPGVPRPRLRAAPVVQQVGRVAAQLTFERALVHDPHVVEQLGRGPLLLRQLHHRVRVDLAHEERVDGVLVAAPERLVVLARRDDGPVRRDAAAQLPVAPQQVRMVPRRERDEAGVHVVLRRGGAARSARMPPPTRVSAGRAGPRCRRTCRHLPASACSSTGSSGTGHEHVAVDDHDSSLGVERVGERLEEEVLHDHLAGRRDQPGVGLEPELAAARSGRRRAPRAPRRSR